MLSGTATYSRNIFKRLSCFFAGAVMAVLILFSAATPSGAIDNAPRKILILHSYHHEFAWTDEIQQGISSTIWAAFPKAELYAEFMNTKRNPPEKVFPQLKELYQKSYSNTRFDVIIVSDNNALDFMQLNRDRLFPGVPVVYCGINNIKDYKFAPGSGYTGVSEDPDLASTIRMALKLHAGTKKIAVISDNTETGEINAGLVRSVLPQFPEIGLIELRRLTADQLSERLKGLAGDTVVLNVSFLRDAAGRIFTPRESMEYIVRNSARPVYTAWDYNMAPGAMGGKMLSGVEQGKHAAELAIKILRGEKADALPMQAGPTKYMITYEGLKKYGIKEWQLPSGTLVTDRPDTVFTHYGNYIWLGTALFAIQCAIIAVLMSNIHRRKQETAARQAAESELRDTNELFKQLLHHSPVYIFVKEVSEKESVVVLASENYQLMIGVAGSQMIGKNMFELFPPELAETITADDWNVVSQKDVLRVEEELDGRYYITIKFPLHKGDRKLLAGYTIDVTERKIAEKKLQYSNVMMNAALESTVDGILVVGRDEKIVRWNRKFVDIWQIPEHLLEARAGGPVLNQMATAVVRPDEFVSKAKELYLYQEVSSFDLLELADGRVLERYSQPLRIGEEIVARFWSFRDITELKEYEKEQLKIEKLESLGVLAGGIAHDFNNILTGIMGNISFARLMMDESSKAYRTLKEAEKATHRASELARQLLTFARGGEPRKKAVSIRHLLKEAASLVLRGSNVKGVFEISDDLLAVEADAGQLNQVFTNIVINAAQAMPGGGTLLVSAENVILDSKIRPELPPGSYVKICFRDEGCGIADDQLQKIFDPYFTTKPAGHGLGLASAHSVVKRHGGAIKASSIPGKGTTFTIYLPAIEETEENTASEPVTAKRVVGAGLSVMVMDDDEMILKLAAANLEHLGFQVTCCKDGAESVRLYQSALDSGTPFDVVIMDLTIPGGMGGREAAEKILALDKHARLIVSSGYSNDHVMSDYKNYGFSGVVAKPYNVEGLMTVLTEVLSMAINRVTHS